MPSPGGDPRIHGTSAAQRRKRRAERVAKLEVLQARVAEMVNSGDEKYVAGALGAYTRAEERIAKYEGLDEPEQVEQTVTTVTPDLAALIAQARGTDDSE